MKLDVFEKRVRTMSDIELQRELEAADSLDKVGCNTTAYIYSIVSVEIKRRIKLANIGKPKRLSYESA